MRIIHTSDWHLGRNFGPLSLYEDQVEFTNWFVELVADQQADLVVIAGDLYDRAIPPVDAIDLFGRTVKRLLDLGVVIAAITGNHDGPDRVVPYSDLLDQTGFYLRGGYHGVGEVITHTFSDGPLDIALLPYLDPHSANDSYGVDEGSPDVPNEVDDLVEQRRRRTHESVLRVAANSARQQLRSGRSIAVAHAYVSGATTSDSERKLTIGGTDEVQASVFEGFSYVALGHLHRPQSVGSETVRYSGTPLAYSFSEQHPKSVVVVDMDSNGTTEVSTVRVGVGRAVQTVTGKMTELLDPASHREAQRCFVRAIVTDRGVVLNAKHQLAELYPFVTEVQLMPDGMIQALGAAPAGVRDLEPIDAARQFWEEVEGSTPSEPEDAVLVDALRRANAREAM
ncbi:MAG: exonuclease SbcCD subunit D [Acidimicrobiales bacterium]|nr:exonuclease SbcCD subunit D [Acidimicrobiales bacterium]